MIPDMKRYEMNIKEQYEPPLLQDICPVSVVRVEGTSGDDDPDDPSQTGGEYNGNDSGD